MMFLQTVSQSLGPENMVKFINPEEAIKRLAAAQGIDTLNLVKTAKERDAEMQQMQMQAMSQNMVGQASDLMKAPMLDPSKNPEALDGVRNFLTNAQQSTGLLTGQPQQPQPQ